ncbi:MAG: TonB-dependent receptor [Desulfacinum sp.]|nr:TonB-dependent receptor [Desulfacinum sp.]
MGRWVAVGLLFCLGAAGVGPASGQTPQQAGLTGHAGKEATFRLEQVVVTASRFPTEMEKVPGRMNVITAEEIQRMPFARIDELLQQISGVQTNRTLGIFELSPQVTLRGLGGNEPGRTLVLVDGVPASVGDTGNMRWNRVNLADVERIEIFKGPGSSIYGSNAMGGVINIITKRPEKPFVGEVSAGYGSFDTKQGKIRLGARQAGDRGLYGQVAASLLDSDGYTSLTEESRDYTHRIDRFVEEFTLNSKIGYSFSENHSLEMSHSYFDDRRGEGYKYNIGEGSHRDFDTNALSLLYRGSCGPWQWRLNGYYQREEYYWHRDFSDPEDLYTVNSDRDDYGATASVARDVGRWSTHILGADARVSRVDAVDDYDLSDRYARNEGRLDQVGLYVQSEFRLLDDRLILVGGIRYDTAKFHDGAYASNISPFDRLSSEMDDNDWQAFSPKLSARYHLSDKASIYGSYSRGFRAPILDALCRYGIFHGRFYDANPELENETLDSFELGGDLNLFDSLDLSVSAYYARGKDFIYSVDTGETRFLWGRDRSVYIMDNVTEVEIAGLEADLAYHLNSRLSFFVHYTFNDSTIESFRERPELEGKTLEYVPKHSVSAGIHFRNPLFNAQVVLNHVGSQYADDMNTEEIDSYETVDLKLWRELDVLVPGMSVDFTVQNLFDEEYLLSEEEKSPGMFAMVELKYRW